MIKSGTITKGDYLSVNEAAHVLDCSTWTVLRYIKAKKLPGKKVAGKWYVSGADIKNFLNREE